MLKQMWKDLPMSFKVLWAGALALKLGLIGFVVWAVYRMVMHFTGG